MNEFSLYEIVELERAEEKFGIPQLVHIQDTLFRFM